MHASGNEPPWISVPSKSAYLRKDLERNAKYFGVNLQFTGVSKL